MRLDRGVLDGANRHPVDVFRAKPVRRSRPVAGAHASNRAFRQTARGLGGRVGDHRRNQVRVLGFGTGEVSSAVEAQQSANFGVGERR
jgi:hypothetical protein